MKRITTLVALALVAGCSRHAPVPEIQKALQPGMTQDEVARVIDGRGALEREFLCPSKHVWSERKASGAKCPECGATSRISELWILFKSNPGVWGSVYLRIRFDERGKLSSTNVGDM
jgi:hypothetical protein